MTAQAQPAVDFEYVLHMSRDGRLFVQMSEAGTSERRHLEGPPEAAGDSEALLEWALTMVDSIFRQANDRGRHTLTLTLSDAREHGYGRMRRRFQPGETVSIAEIRAVRERTVTATAPAPAEAPQTAQDQQPNVVVVPPKTAPDASRAAPKRRSPAAPSSGSLRVEFTALAPAPATHQEQSSPERRLEPDPSAPVPGWMLGVPRVPRPSRRTSHGARSKRSGRLVAGGAAALLLILLGAFLVSERAAGPTYGAVCTDTRTQTRVADARCDETEDVFVWWYIAAGGTAPAVGDAVSVGEGSRTAPNDEATVLRGIPVDGGLVEEPQ